MVLQVFSSAHAKVKVSQATWHRLKSARSWQLVVSRMSNNSFEKYCANRDEKTEKDMDKEFLDTANHLKVLYVYACYSD